MDIRALQELRNLQDGELIFTGYYEVPMKLDDKNITLRFDADVRWDVVDGVLKETYFTDYGEDIALYLPDIKRQGEVLEVVITDLFPDTESKYELLNNVRAMDTCSSRKPCECNDFDVDLKEFVEDRFLRKDIYEAIVERVNERIKEFE